MLRCTRCNAPLQPGLWACPNCGLQFSSPVPEPSISATNKQSGLQNPVVIALLCLFCFPVGCILLLIHPTINGKVKIAVLGSAAVLIIGVGIYDNSPPGKTQRARDDAQEKASTIKQAVAQPKEKRKEFKQEIGATKQGANNAIVYKAATNQSPPADDVSVAQKLAVIDTPSDVPDETVIQKYQDQLDGIKECSSTKTSDERVANVALSVQQFEQKRGVEESSLSILEAVNQSLTRETKQPVADVFAAYGALRVNGMERQQAITQLQGIQEQIMHPQ